MNKRRKTALISAGLAICLLAAWFCLSHDTDERELADFGGRDENAVEVFSIGGEFYYIRNDGELYRADDAGSGPVHRFPTSTVQWSGALDALVYFDNGGIYSYDAASGTQTRILDVDIDVRKGDRCYVILASEDFIYLHHNSHVYRLTMDGGAVTEVSEPVNNQICQNEEYSAFVSYEYQIFIIELGTGLIRQIAFEETDDTVVSGCIVGDTLYYVRFDGKIRAVSLLEEGIQEPEVIQTDAKVLAIAPSEYGLACVTGWQSGDVTYTAAALLSGGQLTALSDPGEPVYNVPGSCKLAVSGSEYCFVVTTSPIVRRGSI